MTDGRIHYTGFEAMTLDLGQGRDVLNADGTLIGTTTINGSGGGDRVMVETTGGTTRVNGQGGDDWLLVNALPTLPDPVNRITGPLTLDGGAGNDTTVIGLFGEGDTTIAAIDTAFDGGSNALVVNGSAADDQFLFRAGLIALLTRDAGVTTGPFSHAEKVTYTNAFSGGVQVNGRAGDDRFAFDDTSSTMSVNGDGGNDFFQVGQLFTDYVPDALFGIPTPAFSNTTRGLLSPGVSQATVINGGTGDDTFQVFRNRGSLQLNGDADDDTFIIRTFIDVDKSTRVNTGGGRDFVQYVANAPVSIDGGDGYDTVVVVGTEANDTFVITAQGIWGAGRFVAYIGVEKLVIEGMEGDDVFYVLSTSANVETAIFGGLGSDTVNVAADVRTTIGPLVGVPAVQANDLLGHSGLLTNAVEQTSGMWVGVPVDGIGAEIVDDDAPAVVLTPLVGTLTVRERGDGLESFVTYTAALAFAPDSDVELTIGTPAASPSAEAIRSKTVLLSLDGVNWQTSVTLRFTPANFAAARQIFVKADFDLSSEGERVVPLLAMIVGQVGGNAAGGTSTTLAAGSNLFAGRTLTGLDVVITAGTGAGQVRRILSHTADTLTLAQPWDTIPTTNSSFLIRGLGAYENVQLPITGIRVLDDDQVGVVVTEQPGGTNVIEGGTTTYQIALTRPPLAQVTVTITSDGQVWVGSPAVTPAGPVFTVVFAAGDAAPKTVTLQARPDGTVEGFHFGYVDHVVASNDKVAGTVAGTTGRMDEFYAPISAADGTLRGMFVRITSGTGAGQIRPIWTNAQTTFAGQPVTLIVVQGDWDTKPDTTTTFEISGYNSAGNGVPEATAATISDDRTTVTFTLPAGTPAPAANSLVGATIRLATGTGANFFRTIVANTATSITVGDAWGSDTPIAAGTPFAVLDMPGITIDRVASYIADVDTRNVIIRESGGATRVVEGGTYDTYTVRLTQAPAPGETVTIRISAQNTPTLDAAIGLASLRNNKQLVVSATPDGTYGEEIVISFTAADWDVEQTVYVKALQDTDAEGGDLQAFPDRPQRVNLVQGPLYVGGGTNEGANYNLDLTNYLPVVLPGESSGHPNPVSDPSANVVELNQIDTLNVFNTDSPAADAGRLSGTRLTGLGMGPDTVIAGRKLNGGITYGEAACATGADQDCLEAVNIHLGYGPDGFLIADTHRGTTAVWAGGGNDRIDVLTLAGHTALFGEDGDDLVRVGTGAPAGPGTIDQIAAHLLFDGGAGFDHLVIDDRADTDANLGRLTQTTITGLDLVSRGDIDRLYALRLQPGAESVTITLAGVGWVELPVATLTTAALESALQALLFPGATCGTGGLSVCARSVFAWQVGGDFLIGFRGERQALSSAPLITFDLGTGQAPSELRVQGITYYGLEVLDLGLGSGDDVLNVQGTGATTRTNVTLGAGDERVYVSSLADVGLAQRPDFLPGTLDLIAGTLNLDLGSGRHQLMISDEAAFAGDDAVITRDRATAMAKDGRATSDAELALDAQIYVVGLAPRAITYRTDGNLADGITYWAGHGDDTILIDATHRNGTLREITSLNTGLGDDQVMVALSSALDGFFVLDTQGAYQQILPGVTLYEGDDIRPADVVLGASIGGVALTAGEFFGHAALDVVGLTVSPRVVAGAVLPTQISLRRVFAEVHVTEAGPVGSRTIEVAALEAGDAVAITVDGVPTALTRDGDLLTFDARGGALVVVTFARESTQDFTGANDGALDNDVVHAETSTLPLVVFGGQGDDVLHGGTGGDVIFGDRGRVLYYDAAQPVPALPGDSIDAVALAVLEAHAVTVLGHGGPGDKTDGVNRLVSLVITVDPFVGGADVVTTGVGADIVLGGFGGDTITTSRGQTPLLPDADGIVLGDNGFVDWARLDGNPSDIDRVRTTDPTLGGADTITTGAGFDLILGGTAGDTVRAGAGNDLVFGDHGKLEAAAGGAVVARALPLATLTDPFTFTAIDTQNSHGGGADTIFGEDGEDIILGQQGADTIYAGAGDDDVFGGHNVAAGQDAGDRIDAGSGNDVVAGDNALILRRGDSLSLRVRPLTAATIYSIVNGAIVANVANGQLRVLNPTGVAERDVLLYDDGAADTTLFGNDVMAGGAGADVLFGQMGDDTIQGDGSVDLPAGTSAEAPTDGDDYVEGGGGADLIFGGLGQDDLIGGSSTLYLPAGTLRPDGADTIYGGAGTRIAIDDPGDESTAGHARDADVILGDNGAIYRLVGAGGQFLQFNYDSYGTLKVIPRAVVLLDYSPRGDNDYVSTNPTDQASSTLVTNDPLRNTNHGGADFLHGESGDDIIHGQTGSDRIWGEGQSDDLYGESGSDWISGGTGVDGILGDDGLLLTSRNGTAEPLYGIAATTQTTLTLNGDQQDTVINVTGLLNKAADLEPFYIGHNDVAYGGLGNDFMHGGAGDDAMSGAEALPFYYVADPLALLAQYYLPGNVLQHGFRDPEEHRYFDENDPWRKVMVPVAGGGTIEFLLNFRARLVSSNPNAVIDDGRDALFGDVGHDWLVGGTNRDHLYGGYGDDLLQADDDLETTFGNGDPLANDRPDPRSGTTGPPSFADIAFGGAGRDVIIANTITDRLYDLREFDSFFVPFSAFGNPTVSRSLPPDADLYFYALSRADGADRTRGNGGRNGEPFGEIGLVTSQDADWQDQSGPPSDPQPGTRNGARDTGSTAEFGIFTDADNGSSVLFSVADATVTEADTGTTTVSVVVTRSGPATSAVSVTVATAPGTALAGSDYQTRTATLTFAAGVTQMTFVVTIVNNNTAEPTEQFSVVLSSPSGATISDRTGIVTIVDDDGAVPALFAAQAAPDSTSGKTLSGDGVPVASDSAQGARTRTGLDTSSRHAAAVVMGDRPRATLAGGRQKGHRRTGRYSDIRPCRASWRTREVSSMRCGGPPRCSLPSRRR
jgi:Ca2+-binding RTX toxin-like protein